MEKSRDIFAGRMWLEKLAADTISHYYVYKISFSKTPDGTVIRIDALFMCIVVSK